MQTSPVTRVLCDAIHCLKVIGFLGGGMLVSEKRAIWLKRMQLLWQSVRVPGKISVNITCLKKTYSSAKASF